MKNSLKKLLSLLLTSLMLTVLIPGSAWAEEEITEPGMASLNPAFVQYQEDVNAGTLNTSIIDGHGRGYIPPPLKRYEGMADTEITSAQTLPAAFDLRETGRITAVRSQGDYGSCWAFASLASLESYIKKDTTVDFSENNLMWNSGFDGSPDDGGNYSMATAYLARWSGPVSESSDPYDTPKKTGLSPVYHVQEVKSIPELPSAIKQALMDGGVLYTSMYSVPLDGEEYYNPDTFAFYYDGTEEPDHDVAIVGWDDNYSRDNFSKKPEADGAWIIRNSWGADWGDGGYFYMSYYDTYAGSNVTAFHNAEATNNYSAIYQYDPLGNISAMGYTDGDNTAWGANIFTATASDNLMAVSTYALTPGTSAEIKVYTDVNDGKPNSGTLRTTQTETFARGGYYTIDLDNPVGLVAGQKFAVVVKYRTPGTNDSVPVESRFENYSSAVTANPGESFTSNTGTGGWYDTSKKSLSNVCIKAFTQSRDTFANCLYRTHVQDQGWQNWQSNGGVSGTSGESLRLEGIEIKMDTRGYDLGIEYATHVQNQGWQELKSNGVMSGTEGQSLRLEAIKIQLTGADATQFDVYYRVHAQNVGWMDWASNGGEAGTAGFGYRLEAIEIQVLPKGSPAPGLTGQPFLENK
ncbi:lectin like domain-containing protein [Acetobacterium wieringae]|uniref:lectin like domain-containing protein n=1 Tax=Acetobacterium wieringae TaxID=52694 RepID=UPI002B205D17|nr:lectin like domain-containing protein [Acetobacterium wieringae]MEA4807018.1 lectin like domain-containing protein [Acetobacterium wieringae]